MRGKKMMTDQELGWKQIELEFNVCKNVASKRYRDKDSWENALAIDMGDSSSYQLVHDAKLEWR